ncbi:MAG: CRISPR-associated endonuclease Cas1 [Chloroflexi bacterium]|nr:CRISPR-associated endonuclease Cas1 [Chloroflexota bacterium]MCI0728541.1 CRISPR-associated endonuclease Cas1 [Chloroflexota bacterium]
MSIIYVKEQGAVVRRRGERILVSKNGETLDEFPLAKVEEVALYGNIQVTAQAMATLLEKGVRVIFLSSFGKIRGVVSEGSKQARLRREQYRMMSDEAFNLRLARAIVEGKIHNQRVLLQRQTHRTTSLAQRDPTVPAFPINIGHFNQAQSGMLQMGQQAVQARDIDTVRGYEGRAAVYYFAAIRSLLDPAWKFEKRAYHPPPDPFNALLSFCYSLLQKDVVSAVNLVGLDVYLGAFHEIDYGRPSLALDLMEEWRPLVADAMALELVNRGALRPEDFTWTTNSRRPVELGEAGTERVFHAYGQRLEIQVSHPLAGGPAGGETPLRRLFELQVRRLARVLTGQEAQYEAVKAK